LLVVGYCSQVLVDDASDTTATGRALQSWGEDRWKRVAIGDRGDYFTIYIDVRDDPEAVPINEVAARGYCDVVSRTIANVVPGFPWEAVIRQYGRTVRECRS
jgi:hypothetical protein